MMINKVNTRALNPVLHYKLDPGEPGLATPTRASQSVAKVATHEGTNIRRFKREAAEDGAIVVYSQISLNMQQAGGFLAATSGKSKALVIYPSKVGRYAPLSEFEDDTDVKKDLDDPAQIDNDPNRLDEASSLLDEPAENEDKSGTKEATGVIDVLNSEIQKLEAEKTTLVSMLSSDNAGIDEEDDGDPVQKEELNRVKAKILALEQEKEKEMQKQFFENISDNTINNNLIKALYQDKVANGAGAIIDQLA